MNQYEAQVKIFAKKIAEKPANGISADSETRSNVAALTQMAQMTGEEFIKVGGATLSLSDVMSYAKSVASQIAAANEYRQKYIDQIYSVPEAQGEDDEYRYETDLRNVFLSAKAEYEQMLESQGV